mmetsp:Transcript_67831/g.60967  ORF Transcript_67831/g.60967 Transcript_67831/m.60967 type:complete len:175 (+) Transcript_67831:121-645(+)
MSKLLAIFLLYNIIVILSIEDGDLDSSECGVGNQIDWSSRESTQKYLNKLASKLTKAALSKDIKVYNWRDALQDMDDALIVINEYGVSWNKQDFLKWLIPMNFKEYGAYFDLITWSKDQVLAKATYTFTSHKDKKLVWRSNLMIRLNENNKISFWIYILEESMKKEILNYFNNL